MVNFLGIILLEYRNIEVGNKEFMVIFVCIFDQTSSLRYFKLVINAENIHTNVGVLNWWSVEDKNVTASAQGIL